MKNFGLALKKWVRSNGEQVAVSRAMEAVETGKIKRKEINYPGLVNGMLGDDAPRLLKAVSNGESRALESAEAVDVSAFTNIVGQLLVRDVQDQYTNPEFQALKMVKVIDEPNPGAILDEYKIPRISTVIDEPVNIQPQMPYPSGRFVEDWITLPKPKKYGEVLRIGMETMMSDRTGQIPDSVTQLSRRLMIQLEEEILNVILGLTNNFKWKGTTYNTYLTSGSWINKKSGVTVAGGNWEIINNIEQLFARMTDPYSGKVIDINPTAILCMPENRYDFKRILKATSVRTGDITTGAGTQGEAPNPLDNDYPVWSSKYARALLSASGVSDANLLNYFYMADFPKAFVYRQVEAPTTITAPPNNSEEFNQDIVLSVKVRRYGSAGVWDPRYTAWSYGS